MGKFVYEGGVKTEIEDRALTHLQLVITAKLRRWGALPLQLARRRERGRRAHHRVDPARQLSRVQVLRQAVKPSINRAWIEALAFTANAPSGLYLVPEPAEAGEEPGAGECPGHASSLTFGLASRPTCIVETHSWTRVHRWVSSSSMVSTRAGRSAGAVNPPDGARDDRRGWDP